MPTVTVDGTAIHYDLRRSPIICPKCKTEFNPDALLRSRRNKPAAPEKAPAAVAAAAQTAVQTAVQTAAQTRAHVPPGARRCARRAHIGR